MFGLNMIVRHAHSLRFREVAWTEPAWYVAWFEPQHHIVEYNAAFFADRFASMNWSILTPRAVRSLERPQDCFTGDAERSSAPGADAVEDLWRTYYRNISTRAA
jgi:uracil-DNA glycosylase